MDQRARASRDTSLRDPADVRDTWVARCEPPIPESARGLPCAGAAAWTRPAARFPFLRHEPTRRKSSRAESLATDPLSHSSHKRVLFAAFRPVACAPLGRRYRLLARRAWLGPKLFLLAETAASGRPATLVKVEACQFAPNGCVVRGFGVGDVTMGRTRVEPNTGGLASRRGRQRGTHQQAPASLLRRQPAASPTALGQRRRNFSAIVGELDDAMGQLVGLLKHRLKQRKVRPDVNSNTSRKKFCEKKQKRVANLRVFISPAVWSAGRCTQLERCGRWATTACSWDRLQELSLWRMSMSPS